MNTIVYLSGAMSGVPEHNFPAFNQAATEMRAAGIYVFNPAEHFEGRTDLPRASYMQVDFQKLLDTAQVPGYEVRGVVLLPGWEVSHGARAEVTMAMEIGLKFFHWDGRALQPTFPDDPIRATVIASGETRVTDPKTGGQKGQKDARFDLIPTEPLRYLALVYGMGAKKYADDNWRKGYDWKLSYGAMQRHLNAFWGGEDMDPESHLPHLAHAMWHCATLLWFSENYTDGDTRAIPGR